MKIVKLILILTLSPSLNAKMYTLHEVLEFTRQQDIKSIKKALKTTKFSPKDQKYIFNYASECSNQYSETHPSILSEQSKACLIVGSVGALLGLGGYHFKEFLLFLGAISGGCGECHRNSCIKTPSLIEGFKKLSNSEKKEMLTDFSIASSSLSLAILIAYMAYQDELTGCYTNKPKYIVKLLERRFGNPFSNSSDKIKILINGDKIVI